MANKKLQKVQNVAARITLRMPRTEHSTPLLRMLHWLPISSRISYKIDSIRHTSYPKYLLEHLAVYTSASVHPQTRTSSTLLQQGWSANICIPGTQQLEQSPDEVQRIEDMFAFR